MNQNCLAGLRCPECGSEEPLRIEVRTITLMWDDGAEHTGDMEWDEDSYCECGACAHYATVKEFKLENQHG